MTERNLAQYIDARRIVGMSDDCPPTSPAASLMPLDETGDHEPTEANHVEDCKGCGGAFECPQCKQLCGWCFGGAPDQRCNACVAEEES